MGRLVRISGSLIYVTVLILFISTVNSQSEDDSNNECKPGSKPFNKNQQPEEAKIEKSIEHWKGFLLIVAFGVFGLFVSIVFRALRRCLYDDGALLDTYFDAGGDVNFACLTCAVVGRWFWTSGFTWSTASVYEFGIVGQFWHAAAGAAVLLLFTMTAFEIRLKAPGAKTFLQVVSARYGPGPHIVLMIFALTLNIILASAILMEACRILNSLHQDTNTTAICAVLALAIAVSCLVGGVGGNIYLSYFTSLLISGISLVYVIHTFKKNVDDDDTSGRWGDDKKIYWDTCGLSGSNKTKDGGVMTFHSRHALMEGILILLCGLSSVFVNQSFWTGAVVSRPLHTVWGYICGAMYWFSLPFMLALSFGFAYWTLAGEAGYHVVTHDQAKFGYLAVFTSHSLLGDMGDYLFYSISVAATVSACSAEVLSVTSILIYDVYQAYIGPKLSPCDANNKGTLLGYWYHLRQIDYMKYFLVVAVSVIIFAVAILLIEIDIDLPWIYKFLGVICGSAVFPIVVSVGWFRTRAIGVFLGPILGLACGVVTWLVYASSFPGGLEKFRRNTGRQEVFIAGAAMSVGCGALTTIIMSIFCGACNPRLDRACAWAKTSLIDNPLRPWAARYTGGCGPAPDFCTLRQLLRPAEISAYTLGILVTLIIAVVWPALMLLANHFSLDTFRAWVWVAIIWGAVVAGLIALFAAALWLIEICCNGTCPNYADETITTESEDVVSCHSHKYLMGVRRPQIIERVITQPPPVQEIIAAPAPLPHRHVTRIVEPVSTPVPMHHHHVTRVVDPVSAPAPVSPTYVTRLVEPVDTYAPMPVQGLRTSVDYVRPVTRYQNGHYSDYRGGDDNESEINYQLSRDQGFKTTINLDS